MLNNILLAAAVTIPATPYCAPILVKGDIESPIPAVSAPFGGATSALGSYDGPPSMAVAVVATPYDDTVTFSASAVCAELTGTQNPTTSNDDDWKNYLHCVQVMHYFNTKY